MTLLNEMPALQTITITWDAKVMVSSFTLQMHSHSPLCCSYSVAWVWPRECLLFRLLAGFNQRKVQGIDLEQKNVTAETDTFSFLCRTWFRNGSTLHRTTTIGPSAYMKWGSSWLLPMVPASFSLKHVSGMCVFDMCHIQCLPLLHMFPLHVWLFTVLKCNRKAFTRASPEAQHTG